MEMHTDNPTAGNYVAVDVACETELLQQLQDLI
jgi:hypothetical protein